MREVLFRGKDVDTGNWVYGMFETRWEESLDMELKNLVWITDSVGDIYDVDLETVGQYIGLEDIHQHKIFEGDVVRAKSHTGWVFKGVVGFSSASFFIEGDGVSGYRWDDYEVEILGNRFDNPEKMGEVGL